VGAEATDTRTQWFQSQATDFYDTVYRSWSHGMTNVSIPVTNMLKKSWKLAVSVAINISMQLCFVSVHGPRETYFVDEPRTFFWFLKRLMISAVYLIMLCFLYSTHICTTCTPSDLYWNCSQQTEVSGEKGKNWGNPPCLSAVRTV
jgi:hypothetical protein